MRFSTSTAPQPPTRSSPLIVKPPSSTIQVRTSTASTAPHFRYINTTTDKVSPEQRSEAHTTFQSIAFAYAVLSDPARRARYDATGSTAESVDADDFNWSAYYRDLFADAVSTDAIERFAKEYRFSEEEKGDVLAAYNDAEGDMDAVYETVMLSNVVEDDERFRKIINKAIKKGEVKGYDAYTKETKKKRKDRLRAAKAETAEAEEYAKELGVHDELFQDGAGDGGAAKGKKGKKKKGNSEDALAALIKRNQQTRESFLDQLEEKYAPQSKSKRGKKRPVDEEPSEEAFQAAAARLKKDPSESKADGGGSRKKSRR